MQTAVDMYRAKSDSGTADPVVLKADKTALTFEATAERIVVEGEDEYTLEVLGDTDNSGAIDGTEVSAKQKFALLNTDELKDKHLRKLPKYVKNAEVDALTTIDYAALTTKDADGKVLVDFNKGQVIAGILLGAEDKSTAIVKFVAPVSGVNHKDVAVSGLAVIR